MSSSHHSFMSGHGRISNCTEPAAFEDELYYAELERQVLQLTADDDEEDESKPFNFRRASHALTYEANFVAVANFSVASRVTSLSQIKSNGTGVFIPHAIESRTRNSPGRMVSNGRRRVYKLQTTAKYEDQGSCRYA